MEVQLTETESRYFGDLFVCCDVEKAGKVPTLKATELYRSANLPNDVITEITSLAGIPATALHISRAQFYSCLKLIAAYQAGLPLRQELIAASVQLPLPRFSWKDSPNGIESNNLLEASSSNSHQLNGPNVIPPPPVADRKNSLPRRTAAGDWQVESASGGSRRNSTVQQQQLQIQQETATNSDVPSTDSEVEQNESSCGDGGHGIDTGSSSRVHRRRGSPEAWSTNSDSPTPTNSVAERPWAKETLWQGLLGDEHRQLLGTEEESSDRHSSDDDNETDLDTVYQITPEQRDYYYKQFKAVQHDVNGLLSGQVARVFFEKSRIPVEELRHIWQLCDVTRDGALSLAEFTAAMHLVVLRRNNILLPAVLPACLHPNVLQHGTLGAPAPPQEPPEADLLHLNDDDEEDNTDNTVIGANTTVGGGAASAIGTRIGNEKNAMNISTLSASSQVPDSNQTETNRRANFSQRTMTSDERRGVTSSETGSKRSHQLIIASASTNSRQGNQTSLTPPPLPPPVKNRSVSNSPSAEPGSTPPNMPVSTTAKPKDRTLWTTDVPPTQWTKFTESPTSNVSSPGPKPVNFDMQRTAQAVVSDPQILHPVPLRVTPVAGSVSATAAAAEIVNQDAYEGTVLRDTSPKPAPISNSTISANSNNSSGSSSNNVTTHNRESLQSNDLRAIQRPQAKKLPAKNIGALPPPPQRESSVGSSTSGSGASVSAAVAGVTSDITELPSITPQHTLPNKKEPPPLPPPRPHRHGRSSSLDLKKLKMSAPAGQQPEMTAQASFDLQTSTGFADFTHFPDDCAQEQNTEQQQHSLPSQSMGATSVSATAVMPPTRFTLQSNQRVSAFEVYRKPNTPRNSQSPIGAQPITAAATACNEAYQQPNQYNQYQSAQPMQPPPPVPAPFGAAGAAAIAQQPKMPANTTLTTASLPNADFYEKRVNAISETLRHVSFKHDNNMSEILRHLREQNNLLLRLCNDLSDELLSVQTRKEELRLKIEALTLCEAAGTNMQQQSTLQVMRTSSSISAPVTANVTGGSGSSGVHSNV